MADSWNGWLADSVISRAEATRLIAERIGCSKPGDDVASVRNRVSHRIKEAVGKGDLKLVSHGKAGSGFLFGDLTLWAGASKGWSGMFDDWPRTAIPGSMSCAADIGAGFGFRGYGSNKPPTLEQCHAEIERLADELFSLREAVSLARAELDRIRPDAERWQKHRRTMSENAKKPRNV